MVKKGDRLYLAHSCLLIDTVRRWEIKIQGRFYVDLINPFNNNTFENVELLRTLKSKKKLLAYMRTLDNDTCEKIVTYDLDLLRKCDGLVAVFNDYTAGTMMEIFAGAYLYRLPVYVISPKKYHPWLRWLSTEMFTSRVAFEEYLKRQGLKKR